MSRSPRDQPSARSRRSAEERADLRVRAHDLHDQGWTHERIGTALGVSRQWVTRELAVDGDLTRHEQNAVPAKISGQARASGIGVAKARGSTDRTGRRTESAIGGSGKLHTILPPTDYTSRWISKGLDAREWDRMSSPEILRILRHASPEVSRVIWDYLRMLNNGYELIAYKTNGVDEPDERAQAALDAFEDMLVGYYGSLKVQFGRGFMNFLTRGALLVELVTDQAGRRPIDLIVPDPVTIRFRKEDDPYRGNVWHMGQWQNGQFTSLEYPTIKYIAVDPEPDNPYGTAMLESAIFPCLFLIGLLYDLRRVVAQQGYPRTHIIIDIETIRETFPNDTDDELDERIDELQNDVEAYYGSLEPDDAFVTTSTIKIENNGGAIATQVLQSSAALIDVLERMATRALKSNPLLMGLTTGMSEAHANREWEIFAEGINSLQHDAETTFGSLFQLAMEIQGIPCRVELRFAKLRAAEEARDEQTFKLRLENAIVARDTGFWSQEQASMHAVQEPPALEDAPAAALPVVTDGEDDEDQTDAGAKDEDGDNSERAIIRARLAALGITRAVDISRADDDAIDDAVNAWEAVFKGEPEETLLAATVTGAGDAEG